MATPDKVPSSAIIGDTWEWQREYADNPAPTWAVVFYFDGPAGNFSANATANGTAHKVTIPAATTGAYAAGRYRWEARASSGGVVSTIDAGWLDVVASVAAGGQQDRRNWLERAIDSIQAVIEERATTDQAAFTIRDRSVSRMTWKELTEALAWARTELAKVNEAQSPTKGRGRYIYGRFGSNG